MKYNTVIVGGGIAGLTAAAYISRAGRSVVVFEKQPKAGGLVQTFSRKNVFFDSGLRSIENSGIVHPMLRQLGIEIDFVKSPVTIGIGDRVIRIEDRDSIIQYEELLNSLFPDSKKDINRIMLEIRKIMDYMDVLYGIDNPLFLDLTKDKKYLLKVILPWMFKFMNTVRKINRLKEPVDDHLRKLTENRQLIDAIAQHFFQKTPTSFALGYFSLYLDYYYPKGGTAVLIDKMVEFIRRNGGEIQTSTAIVTVNPEEKYVTDDKGNKAGYDKLVWAADMKQLFRSIPLDILSDKRIIRTVSEKLTLLKDLKGGDSVFTVYLTINESKEYFSRICSGHFFYTPVKTGLSGLSREHLDPFLNTTPPEPGNVTLKNRVKDYLSDYCDLNTFEIAIPVLRDETLAPEGQTGLIVSCLFDYQLAKKIDEHGWSEEMKEFLEMKFIQILDQTIFPGIKDKIFDRFSSSPLTIERFTGNSDGGITGWAFTNKVMPAVSNILKVASSVHTPLPSIFQAGQWVYSPSGLPISILTGKLAADKVLKGRT